MANPVLFSNGYVGVATSSGVTAFTSAMNLSGVKSVAAPFSKADLDDAVMGDTMAAKYPGLMDIPITVVVRQDFTTGGATFASFGNDKKFWTAWNANMAMSLQLRAVNSAGAVTNPKYTFSKVRIHNIGPINGSHGELLTQSVEFRTQSGCTVTRVTSST
jgi:hypothetical protein